MFLKSKMLQTLLKKEKKLVVFILVSSILTSFANSLGLTMLIPVLFNAFHLTEVESTINIASQNNLLNKISSFLPFQGPITAVAFVLLLLVCKNILTFIRIRLCSQLTNNNLLFLRQELLNHFLKKELTFFQKTGTGPIFNQLSPNVEKAAKVVLDSIDFVGMSAQLVTYLFVLFFISKTFLIFCGFFCLPLLVLVKTISLNAKKISQSQTLEQGELSQELSNLIQSIRIVKLGARETDHINRIHSKGHSIQNKLKKLFLLTGSTQPISELFGILLLFNLMTITLLKWIEIPATTFFTFLLILSRVLPLFNVVAQRRVEISSNSGSLLSLEAALGDKTYSTQSEGSHSWSKLQSSIRLENVSFSYPESSIKTLNSISFEISPGDHVAIVGPSGSGKSTLVDLILKFYPINEGRITFDGLPLNEIKTSFIRNKIALVPQDAILLFSTLKENLCYFHPQASELEIWRALEQADLAEFVNSLPEGLNTTLGERGVNLSGGQKQRLCIARALLMNPEILIFDEATSSLDSLSESKIVDSIRKASQGRTTITIAHRLGTILHCNKVFMIEHGWLTESGQLSTLLKTASRFRKYAEAQNLLKVG